MVSPASGLTANLTGDPATSDTAPAWSPGRHQDRLHPRGAGGTTSIMTMASGGGGELAVTLATGRTAQVTGGRVVDLLPSWPPL
jgi:hypothetical protein